LICKQNELQLLLLDDSSTTLTSSSASDTNKADDGLRELVRLVETGCYVEAIAGNHGRAVTGSGESIFDVLLDSGMIA
jgi:hypothetical protein